MTKYFSFILLFIILGLSFASASLGISPAKKQLDFTPGAVHTFSFNVNTDNPEGDIEIYFDGDLAEYAVSDKYLLKGSDSFIVTLTLPDSIEVPGDHSLYVRAIEGVSGSDFLGSRIDIGALVRVFVPYPGHYAFLTLDFPDANVNEKARVSLMVDNRGTQSLSLTNSKIDIYNSGKLFKTLNLDDVDIPFAESYTYSVYVDTAEFLPGEYSATASVNTPENWESNDTFRIGSLFFNVTYFTTNFSKQTIQPFFINIQSLWNNDVAGVYADVNITNSSGYSVASMRTPSTDFLKWEQKVLQGFIDATNLNGDYTALIAVKYLDKTTYVSGPFSVYSSSSTYLKYSIIALIVAAILFAVYYFMIRKHRK
ncbi:MAG: hypothetical protein ACP5NS_00010 [Candidatus Pacearchaeota archaeon]